MSKIISSPSFGHFSYVLNVWNAIQSSEVMFSDFSLTLQNFQIIFFSTVSFKNPPFCVVNAVIKKGVKTTDSVRTGTNI